MYFILRHIALLRLIVPFVIGIIVGIYFPVRLSLGYWILLLLLLFILILIVVFWKQISSYKYRWVSGTGILLLFFAAGYFYASAQNISFREDYFAAKIDTQSTIIATVTKQPQEKANSYK